MVECDLRPIASRDQHSRDCVSFFPDKEPPGAVPCPGPSPEAANGRSQSRRPSPDTSPPSGAKLKQTLRSFARSQCPLEKLNVPYRIGIIYSFSGRFPRRKRSFAGLSTFRPQEAFCKASKRLGAEGGRGDNACAAKNAVLQQPCVVVAGHEAIGFDGHHPQRRIVRIVHLDALRQGGGNASSMTDRLMLLTLGPTR